MKRAPSPSGGARVGAPAPGSPADRGAIRGGAPAAALARVRKEPCKVATTYAAGTRAKNGHLIELYKDGERTVAYLTAALPGAFKGYHLHRVRESHYVCVRGRMKITVVDGREVVEHILDASKPERLLLPTGAFIGLKNVGDEEAWLINLPNPPYDPTLAGEQVDKTPEEIARQLAGRR